MWNGLTSFHRKIDVLLGLVTVADGALNGGMKQHVSSTEPGVSPGRQRMYEVIFESDTRSGKIFDVILLVSICLSVLLVTLESVREIRESYGSILYATEWVVTIIFTLEYGVRLYCVRSPGKYARSFFGLVDLVSILPAYLELFVEGTHFLIIVRVLRLLRVFRIFKLAHFLKEGDILMAALRASRPKVTVFLAAVCTAAVVMGTLMYLVEGEKNGFTSIPRGIYWAIVTLTTVGYGDVTPHTTLGHMIATVVMILGYGVLAVPTGIFSVELTHAVHATPQPELPASTRRCESCGHNEADSVASFCKHCGQGLTEPVAHPPSPSK